MTATVLNKMTPGWKARDAEARINAERERTAAVFALRMRAISALRAISAERRWRNASDALVWASGVAAGLALVVGLLSMGTMGIDAQWSIVPSAFAATFAFAAAMLRGPRAYDMSDAVACEQAVQVMSMLVDGGLSGHEGTTRIMKRFEGLVDKAEGGGTRERGAEAVETGDADRLRTGGTRLQRTRRFERLVPAVTETTLTVGGRMHHARIIDVSRSGAAVDTAVRLQPGTRVLIGRRPAKTIRHFGRGTGFEFDAVIPEEMFGADLRL